MSKIICDRCHTEIIECERCTGEFTLEEELICNEGEHHYCEEDCFIDACKDGDYIRTAYAEKELKDESNETKT